LNEIVQISESFNNEYLQDFQGAENWASKIGLIDYHKQRIRQDQEILKFYSSGWMYSMTETDVFLPLPK